jgi:hypothetical protein
MSAVVRRGDQGLETRTHDEGLGGGSLGAPSRLES